MAFIIAPKAKSTAKPIKVRCPVCKAPLAFDGTHRLSTIPTTGRDTAVSDDGAKPTEQQ